MISIFIMYSNDRFQQLEYTVSCLREMTGYEQCQKTLVVDGRLETIIWRDFPEFRVIQVPRIANKFCWADMWQTGVLSSDHDFVLYLDSDRLLPQNYLQLIKENIRDKAFLFTTNHFMVTDSEISLDLCKDFMKNYDDDPSLFLSDEYIGRMGYEQRNKEPVHGPGKNVMSGNTAFTKRTFLDLGGVDRYYCGHGAFADTDFHLQAHVSGCEFVDLQAPELHCHHLKRDESSSPVNPRDLKKMGLDNFIYYCRKWNLPLNLAENVAYECEIERPSVYISKKLKELDAKGF